MLECRAKSSISHSALSHVRLHLWTISSGSLSLIPLWLYKFCMLGYTLGLFQETTIAQVCSSSIIWK